MGKYINLDLYTLDRLSIELFHQHPNLCHQYLGLPIDTGQIVSISQFIDEYNKAAKNIATPIDNKFLHRSTEIKELIEALKGSDFIIVTGSPGVGKTKLALEGIKEYLLEYQNYNAYCVSFKNASLLEDLFQYFEVNTDYILFVDDANRIDCFNQIIGFYKRSRTGNLKIVITVRDYALNELVSQCFEFNPLKLTLNKLTDDQIIDILKSDSFKIYNKSYQKEIVRIADGNPRLAIMAAKIAIEKQNLQVLNDVSELFDLYFTTFIADNRYLTNITNLKTLGLISFFYSIPYKDKSRCVYLLDKFDLSYDDFIDSIDYLNKLELVDLQFDYTRITEQNVATYFFYKTFIKDELLSFETLLSSYYESNVDRFKDTIIPANNTFGYENVIKKVKPYILKYWNCIKNDNDKAYNLLSTFWFYLENETIEYVYNEVTNLPQPDTLNYSVAYDKNQFSYKKNPIIELISKYFYYPSRLKEALELAFEYARKIPESFPELIYNIRERLLFDADDHRMRFERQQILINLILEKCIKADQIYEMAFPAIAISFLQYKYQHTRGGRNNIVYFYQYPFPLNNVTENIRKSIWLKIDNEFKTHTESFFQILMQYSEYMSDVVKEVMEFDLNFVLSIINNHLTHHSFEHCYYVQKQVRWYIRNDIYNERFDILKKQFLNERYLIYLKISSDRLRDKESYEFENYDQYYKMKEMEIRKSFIFDNVNSFADFYEHYNYLLKWEKNTYWMIQAFDVIIDANFKENFCVGMKLLEYIIDKNNEINYLPYTPFYNLQSDYYNYEKIWDIISTKMFKNSTSWQLQYFYAIDESLVNEICCDNLLNSIKNINDYISIHFQYLIKFLKYDDRLFQKILNLIYEKLYNYKIHIRISHDLFTKYMCYLSSDMNIIKQVYIQQHLLDQHYDLDASELLSILKIDKEFLLEFIKSIYVNKKQHRSYEYKNLASIWGLEGIESVLNNVFDYIAEKEIYTGILDHFCNSFFKEFKSETNIKRSNQFLTSYINANYANIKKMKMIVDVLRHTKTDFFEEAYLHYLHLTQDIEIFSKIYWVSNSESGNGNESIGDKIALKWRNLLEITNKADLGIKLIPIKRFINDQIEYALAFAESEKRRRFIENF